jgi:hypothetical protein
MRLLGWVMARDGVFGDTLTGGPHKFQCMRTGRAEHAKMKMGYTGQTFNSKMCFKRPMI